MTRTFTPTGAAARPSINAVDVLEFFEQRARKVGQLGYDRAVIYQDRHPELAARRDRAEKQLLLPKLALTGSERTLDIGCGTGRWAEALGRASAHYRGVDISPGLVDVARNRFSALPHMCFSVLGAEELSLTALNEHHPFDRVLCIGTFMYLNDAALRVALAGLTSVVAVGGLFLLREPLGIGRRLTLNNHFSEEMQQHYSAIYRTAEELMAMTSALPPPMSLGLLEQGDVYADTTLNNRSETRQHWFLFRRLS